MLHLVKSSSIAYLDLNQGTMTEPSSSHSPTTKLPTLFSSSSTASQATSTLVSATDGNNSFTSISSSFTAPITPIALDVSQSLHVSTLFSAEPKNQDYSIPIMESSLDSVGNATKSENELLRETAVSLLTSSGTQSSLVILAAPKANPQQSQPSQTPIQRGFCQSSHIGGRNQALGSVLGDSNPGIVLPNASESSVFAATASAGASSSPTNDSGGRRSWCSVDSNKSGWGGMRQRSRSPERFNRPPPSNSSLPLSFHEPIMLKYRKARQLGPNLPRLPNIPASGGFSAMASPGVSYSPTSDSSESNKSGWGRERSRSPERFNRAPPSNSSRPLSFLEPTMQKYR